MILVMANKFENIWDILMHSRPPPSKLLLPNICKLEYLLVLMLIPPHIPDLLFLRRPSELKINLDNLLKSFV